MSNNKGFKGNSKRHSLNRFGIGNTPYYLKKLPAYQYGKIKEVLGNPNPTKVDRDMASENVDKLYGNLKKCCSGQSDVCEGTSSFGMKQKLLTKSLEKDIPALYATENIKSEDKIVVAHFFSPYTNWDWYIIEGDWVDENGMPVRETGKPPKDYLMYGYVRSPMVYDGEWGYISLNELQSLTRMDGKLQVVERDAYWSKIKFGELRDKEDW